MTTRGIVQGDMLLDRDGRCDGMVGGDVTVAPGVTVDIAGIVSGSVHVEPGASATISGIVSGDVIVGHGASARIDGIVNGRVVDRGGRVETNGMVR